MAAQYHVFSQNNSFGKLEGPELVIVWTSSADEAVRIALEHDAIYLDGIRDGKDCPCCGDRWSSPPSYEFDTLKEIKNFFRKTYCPLGDNDSKCKEATILIDRYANVPVDQPQIVKVPWEKACNQDYLTQVLFQPENFKHPNGG